MTDYKNLVKFLRGLSPWAFPDASNKRMQEAAAAIEELQAEIRESMQKCAECGDANMPKRGEWKVVEDFDGDIHYQCSVCGEEWYFIDGTPKDNNANFCPQCGAKMEVQE